MSTPAPSAPLIRAAQKELDRLARAAGELRGRRQALQAQLDELTGELKALENRRDLLLEVTGQPAAPPTADDAHDGAPRRVLRGRELRRVAARALHRWAGEEPVHYRELYERVLADGNVLTGKDPAATFLTNLRESPAIVRGERMGHYRLDRAAEGRLAQELAETDAELDDVRRMLERVREHGSPAEAERLRTHHDRLKNRRRRVQADLDEVRFVFAAPDEGRAEKGAGDLAHAA